MARTEAKLACVAITQQLNPDFWFWTDDEKKALESASMGDPIAVNCVLNIIKSRLDNSGHEVVEMYGILHDKDVREVWSESLQTNVIEGKTRHIHGVIKFARDKGDTLTNLSTIIGLEPQYLEKAGQGRYGYDNLLAYLVHAKYENKYQYSTKSVITVIGKPYSEVVAERWSDWMKGRAAVNKKRASEDIDSLLAKILSGEVTRSQILLTDSYFAVYQQYSRKCDEAFAIYGERKAYKTIQAMENGEFKLSVYFITGKSGEGKSYFTTGLVRSIIAAAREQFGETWTAHEAAASNPFDDWNGEEILVMDDLRGSSMTASDWLKLLDPDRVSMGSARYKNKRMACRVVVINSEKDVLDFFYYVKNAGGGNRSEAMDQFFRRILARVQVYRVPDSEERRVQIAEGKRTEEYHKLMPGGQYGRGEVLPLHYDFQPTADTADMAYDDAITMLTAQVINRNQMNRPLVTVQSED